MAILGKTDSRSAGGAPAAGTAPSPAATVVGQRSRFVGELSGEDVVVVEGRVEGTVRGSERVTVGSAGDVEGDIHARAVLVKGRVHGQIFAAERAELSATAVVEGSVDSPKIVIAEGARLEGSVAMGSKGEPGASRTSEG